MYKRNKLVVLLTIAAVLLGSGVFTYSKIMSWHKKELTVLKVWESEKSLQHLPVYVAMDQGFFTEAGIKLEIISRTDQPATDPYAESVADLILTDPVEHIYQQSVNPAAPKIVAIIAARDDTFLLGRKKEPFTWEMLKDLNMISFPPETGPGFALDKILRQKELQPMHDLSLYNRIPPDLRLGAFKAGSGSFIQLQGSEAYLAEAEGIGYIAASVGEEGGRYPSMLCTAWPQIIQQKPEAIQGFVNAIYKAQLWMEHEPELCTGSADSHLKNVDKKVRGQVLDKYIQIKMWQPDPVLEKNLFEEIQTMLDTVGLIPATVTYTEAVDNSFSLSAKEKVKYIPKEEREQNWLKRTIKRIF
ncbi:NitT/TauT family transport system substrate-binding protein [Desulfotomaculum arcticum]|uniref:NitT/TauT family transport system substrate-binding protein n=1 Tax=Desulfotruncus arcticus DSM 17038 TaxID=1121424 RepID=A0A1I2UKT7_9FIRM|nr:ABC transporter substrate-binding protein [Desulfotruncus arcticus]SFG76257.1 NitT/TauT family transport system substrate-binding protein [Desulfotomaculum arcticum] [Desulfotruncus arcticus DSM 17038]